MNDIEYTRNCPKCNKKLIYKTKSNLKNANSKNAICKQCSDLRTRFNHNLNSLEKFCSKCKIWKIANLFGYKANSPDKLRNWCKECHLFAQKKRYSNLSKEEKQKRCDNVKRWYKENSDIVLKNRKNKHKLPHNKYLIYKSRAKKDNLEFLLTLDEFLYYENNNCFYCDEKLTMIALDRIDSSKGYTIENVVPCCIICNKMKLDHTQLFFINHIKKILANMSDMSF